MRKKIFLFGVFLWVGLAGALQASPVGYGIKAGVNLSNRVFNTYGGPGAEPLFGFLGGGFVDFALTDVLSLQPEIYYTMKGAEIKSEPLVGPGGEYEGSTPDVSVNSYYLETPVLLKLNLKGGGSTGFNFFAGPSIGFFLNGQSKIQGGPTYNFSLQDRFDLGLIMGVGLEIGKTLLDLRYDLGLDNQGLGSDSVLSLLVGYRIQ